MRQTELLEGPHKTTGISLPETLMNATREQAKIEQRPFSWVVQRALVAYLTENNKVASDGAKNNGA